MRQKKAPIVVFVANAALCRTLFRKKSRKIMASRQNCTNFASDKTKTAPPVEKKEIKNKKVKQ